MMPLTRRASAAGFAWLCVGIALELTGTLLYPQTSWAARSWEKVPIPDARCGDGSNYSVFLSLKDPKKITVDLMGGGACWGAATCYGPALTTWIHPLPTVLEQGGLVSDQPDESPLYDSSIVFFPYCTGDVHLGNHTARYSGLTVHHMGRSNVERGIAYLNKTGRIDLAQAEQIVLYGYSAGALGAIYHMSTLDQYVGSKTHKVMISDAPGLHFGPKFWDKFTPKLISDYDDALSRLKFRIHPDDGMIAPMVRGLCRFSPGWRIGFIQGTRDSVMAAFGEILPEDHHNLVTGPTGLYRLTESTDDHCSSWIADTEVHTFLVTGPTAAIRNTSGKSAMDFLRDFIAGRDGLNSR